MNRASGYLAVMGKPVCPHLPESYSRKISFSSCLCVAARLCKVRKHAEENILCETTAARSQGRLSLCRSVNTASLNLHTHWKVVDDVYSVKLYDDICWIL